MPIETYEQAVAFWNSRINYEKIGMPQDVRLLKLDRIRLMLQILGNPHERYKIVHVTGTKGKGSTATMIASVLQAAGFRTGLYTSPHLVHVEERIQIDRINIDRESMTQCMNQVADVCLEVETRGELPPTFFEIITAVGLLHFAQSRVDWSVLEVGMGGRFDATNVVTPQVSVITSIGLDHLEQLGDTLEKIAFEKAGIIKNKVPVVSGVTQADPARVIQQQANDRLAQLFQLGRDFIRHWKPGIPESLELPELLLQVGKWLSPWYRFQLWGEHQADNAAIALKTIQVLQQQGNAISPDAITEGLLAAQIPGRLETLGLKPRQLIDAAHNVDSIAVLLNSLKYFPHQKLKVLFAVSRDKQIKSMLELLSGQCHQMVFTKYTSSPRGADPRELQQFWESLGQTNSLVVEPPVEGWNLLKKHAHPDDLLLATGSVFLVGEIRQLYHPS